LKPFEIKQSLSHSPTELFVSTILTRFSGINQPCSDPVVFHPPQDGIAREVQAVAHAIDGEEGDDS
jgi:hypothetical protein